MEPTKHVPPMPQWENDGQLSDAFVKWWMTVPKYRGVKIIKSPFNLSQYSEIIFETRPTIIIETGTKEGGGALWLADHPSENNEPHTVISIDLGNVVTSPIVKDHPNLQLWNNISSIDPKCIADIKSMIESNDRVMVILDADHTEDFVLKELQLYGPLVSKGCYLISEDQQRLGPPAAVKRWDKDGFVMENNWDQIIPFGMNHNYGGAWRKR